MFDHSEIDHFASTIGVRGRLFGTSRPGAPFTEIPDRPRVMPSKVALAAAVLEGRLLALRLPRPGDGPPVAPDQTLAVATDYSRDNMRRALSDVLHAIGLTAPMPRYPSRSVPAGSTRAEVASFNAKQRKSSQRRAARAKQRQKSSP